jgi:hypothetical protein
VLYCLSHTSSPFSLVILETGPWELFAWLGFKPQSSQSQPLKLLGLQVWATGALLFQLLMAPGSLVIFMPCFPSALSSMCLLQLHLFLDLGLEDNPEWTPHLKSLNWQHLQDIFFQIKSRHGFWD